MHYAAGMKKGDLSRGGCFVYSYQDLVVCVFVVAGDAESNPHMVDCTSTAGASMNKPVHMCTYV